MRSTKALNLTADTILSPTFFQHGRNYMPRKMRNEEKRKRPQRTLLQKSSTLVKQKDLLQLQRNQQLAIPYRIQLSNNHQSRLAITFCHNRDAASIGFIMMVLNSVGSCQTSSFRWLRMSTIIATLRILTSTLD